MLPNKIIVVDRDGRMTAHEPKDTKSKGSVTEYERHHLLSFYEHAINNKPIADIFGKMPNETKTAYSSRLAYLQPIVTKVFMAVNYRFFYIEGNPIRGTNGYCGLCEKQTKREWEAYIQTLEK